ncbi:hypothetical protein B5S30_g4818 [[Candida] boidinii]|nr:hypothetical protein B5S30_g4818 [[Candida] boidinii]GMF98338.1 unnamed protein product [[Candida] boidinii]
MSQIEKTSETVEGNGEVQFRIIVGSYEHSLLCLSLILPNDLKNKQPIFQPIFHFQAHSLSIRCMDIAKRYLVTGSNDEHIKIYDLQKRKELGTLLQHQGSITSLVFSDDKDEEDDEDEAEEDEEKKQKKQKQIQNQKKSGRSLKKNAVETNVDGNKILSHKSGKWLLSASDDGKIVIWRTKDWESYAVLKGHQGRINDLAIHPSGRIAVSVSEDKTIKLWNLMTAKKASTLKLRGRDTLGQSGQSVRFSKDGEFFIISFINKMILFNTRKGTIYKKFKLKNKTIMKLDFIKLNNIEYLIIALNTGSINFYKFEDILNSTNGNDDDSGNDDDDIIELSDIKTEFELLGHSNRVKDFSIYQEEHKTGDIKKILTYLISVSSDGRIVIWDLNLRDQVAVYSTGERLNVVTTVSESIEKASTMKKREDDTENGVSNIDSEYESDGEGLAEIMKGRKKKLSKKAKRKQKEKLISVELE